MSKGITLSRRHGLNPTIPVCFWCRKQKNEIAVLGRIWEKDENGNKVRGSDVKAPRETCLDYEPYEECKELISQGVHVVEIVTTSIDQRPPIGKDNDGNPVYPTGRWLVINPEVFNSDTVRECGKCAVDVELFNNLIRQTTNS